MKFDFNNSQYAKFWDSRDAANALRIFINDPDIIAQRDSFWRKNFDVDPMLTTRNYDGTANFNATVRKRNVANMLDWRAPLAETQPRDKSGLDAYQGPIPDFAAKGYVENAMEREARQRMFEEYFGNDAEILSAYADEIQVMVDEGNQTLSNLAAQLLTKGNMTYGYGSGIKGNIYKAPIPAENFVKAGVKVWSDPDCKLLDQMAKIEQDYRDATGSQLALKWQVTRDTFFNVILKNAQVIEWVNQWRKVHDKPYNEQGSTNKWGITADMFNEAFLDNPLVSPIEVVEEAQRDGSVGVVHGWAANTAVLRPVGYAGILKRAGILDQTMSKKYGSSVINEVYAQLDIFTIVNTTLNNGRFKEWHTDLLVSAVPTLDEFLDHIIVDIATANA